MPGCAAPPDGVSPEPLGAALRGASRKPFLAGRIIATPSIKYSPVPRPAGPARVDCRIPCAMVSRTSCVVPHRRTDLDKRPSAFLSVSGLPDTVGVCALEGECVGGRLQPAGTIVIVFDTVRLMSGLASRLGSPGLRHRGAGAQQPKPTGRASAKEVLRDRPA
jgi:hypothetical protein